MNWASALATYFLVWWLVLFAILPMFGVRREDNPSAGTDHGAPARPRLWLKVGVTSAVAALVWGLGFIALEYGFIDLDLDRLSNSLR